MWWEERYWLLLDAEWEAGRQAGSRSRAPLVTVALWVATSSQALLMTASPG